MKQISQDLPLVVVMDRLLPDYSSAQLVFLMLCEFSHRVGVTVSPVDLVFERLEQPEAWVQLPSVTDNTDIASTLREMESPVSEDEGGVGLPPWRPRETEGTSSAAHADEESNGDFVPGTSRWGEPVVNEAPETAACRRREALNC